jgi:hypothetical protein
MNAGIHLYVLQKECTGQGAGESKIRTVAKTEKITLRLRGAGNELAIRPLTTQIGLLDQAVDDQLKIIEKLVICSRIRDSDFTGGMPRLLTDTSRFSHACR